MKKQITKLCKTCGEVKELTLEFFSKCEKNSNSFRSNCKKCRNKQAKEYQVKTKNAKNRYSNMSKENRAIYISKVTARRNNG